MESGSIQQYLSRGNPLVLLLIVTFIDSVIVFRNNDHFNASAVLTRTTKTDCSLFLHLFLCLTVFLFVGTALSVSGRELFGLMLTLLSRYDVCLHCSQSRCLAMMACCSLVAGCSGLTCSWWNDKTGWTVSMIDCQGLPGTAADITRLRHCRLGARRRLRVWLRTGGEDGSTGKKDTDG